MNALQEALAKAIPELEDKAREADKRTRKRMVAEEQEVIPDGKAEEAYFKEKRRGRAQLHRRGHDHRQGAR